MTITTVGSIASPASAHIADTVESQRRHIVKRALAQIGKPYRYAAESPSAGFDCSGLTYWTFKDHGAKLPRRSIDQWRLRSKPRYKRIWDKSNLRRGDLVFFKTTSAPVGHVGIYVGDMRFVHSGSRGVRRDSLLDRSYWKPRYVGAVRVPALQGPSGSGADGAVDEGDN